MPTFTYWRNKAKTWLTAVDFQKRILISLLANRWKYFLNNLKIFFLESGIGGDFFEPKNRSHLILVSLNIFVAALTVLNTTLFVPRAPQSLISPTQSLRPIEVSKSNKEVFGFAPYWNFGKLDGIDFNTLTTLAYFGVPVDGNGNLVRDDVGYQTFKSHQATELFSRAHQSGTRVVLTLTQMNNGPILALMDNPDAKSNMINQAVDEVQKRGIDGVNVDFEYNGDPGQDYRDKFSQFIANLTTAMHNQNPDSKVTVSVYAASVKEPKIYDVGALAKNSDGVFMMAYDFANASSGNAIPTAPLYGYKQGQYWYDVSTAVDDFLTQMPPQKLILGVPWYGYDYLVYSPQVKASTIPYWGSSSTMQTYATAADNLKPDAPGILNYQTGWDNLGEVGWKAYYDPNTGSWRMLFIDDTKSLSLKYDLAKNKNLEGIGIWALGFDQGKNEMWSLIREKFGLKMVDSSLAGRPIADEEN